MQYEKAHVKNTDGPQPKKKLREKGSGNHAVVLTTDEVQRVIMATTGVHHVIAKVLYGSGLRLIACLKKSESE